MFENIIKFFKKLVKAEQKESNSSKDMAKERLHLVLMQDRANVSADFLELMKQEIIEVIKKYIDVDESAIDVRLTNKANEDGTNGAPALYANIPIMNIKEDVKKQVEEPVKEESKEEIEEKLEESKEEKKIEEEEVETIEKIQEVEEEKPQEKKESKEEKVEQTENKE